MLYDCAVRIKALKKELPPHDELIAKITEIAEGLPIQMKLNILTDNQMNLLLKAQASVSSMPALHDNELLAVVDSFKKLADEVAAEYKGEISKAEGFYHNTKKFAKLYDYYDH
jgi:hypothetical protein